MTAWRVAGGLDELKAQIDVHAPHRSKLSDGSIGDAAHASRVSDHNPRNIPGLSPAIVTARDFTHDPAHGCDGTQLANELVASGDNRIKYVIWNHRIWQNGWTAYSGADPHTGHVHLSVVGSAICDSRNPWHLPMFSGQVLTAVAAAPIVVTQSVPFSVESLQRFAVKAFPAYARGIVADGVIGPMTTRWITEFQRRSHLAPDGVVGSLTLAALRRNGFKG